MSGVLAIGRLMDCAPDAAHGPLVAGVLVKLVKSAKHSWEE